MATTLVSVDSIVKAIQTVMLTLPGIENAPDYPPEKAGEFPFVITWVRDGECKWTASGFVTNLPNVVVQIHWAFKNFATTTEAAYPFLELTLKALFNDVQMSTTISAGSIQTPITYSFGFLGYFGTATLGWEFVIPIKSAGDTS